MLTALISFLLGVFFAPVVRPMMRPLALEIMKLFVSASNEVRSAAAKMKEEVEDAVAATEAERAAKQAAATQSPTTEPPKQEPGHY
jgi:hypothetical protein